MVCQGGGAVVVGQFGHSFTGLTQQARHFLTLGSFLEMLPYPAAHFGQQTLHNEPQLKYKHQNEGSAAQIFFRVLFD